MSPVARAGSGMLVLVLATVLVALLAGPATPQEPAAAQPYAVGNQGWLELATPPGWQASFGAKAAGAPPTVSLFAGDKRDPLALITPLWDPSGKLPTPEMVRRMAEAAGTLGLERAVEKTAPLEDLRGPETAGHFVFLTDRKYETVDPPPGEYRYLRHGFVAVGPLILSFTVLSSQRDTAETRLALGAVTAARHRAPTGRPAAADAPALTLPGRRWELRLALPGFTVTANELRDDGEARRLAAQHEASGLILTAVLERVTGAPDGPGCREHGWQRYWSRVGERIIRRGDVTMTERAGLPASEYVIRRIPDALVPESQKELRGREINQKHVNAYLARDGVCVDVHLSKMQAAPADEALVDAVLHGLRIQDSR